MGPTHQRAGTAEPVRIDPPALGALEAVEPAVLLLVAPDHDLEVLGDAKVPAEAQQGHVVHRGLRLGRVREQIAQPPREARVGEQAAAAGRGVVPEAVTPGQAELVVAAAAADREQARAVHPAASLGLGLGQELRRERAQHPARALAHHLAGEQEGGLELLEPGAREPEHEDPAVHARVHVAPVAPARMAQQSQVFLALGARYQPDAQVARHLGHVVAARGRGFEVEADHLDPLIDQQARGQGAVEAAGEHAECTDRHRPTVHGLRAI